MDNLDSIIVEAVDAVDILVVTDSQSADPVKSDTVYLLAALGYGAGGEQESWRSVFRPKLVSPKALASERLSRYRCIVLANESSLPEESVDRLGQYVKRGGGMWIAAGDRADQEFFNRSIFAQGAGLSPLGLDVPVGDVEDHSNAVVIHPPPSGHPATSLLSDTDRLDIDQGRVLRRHQFDMAGEAQQQKVSVLLRTADGAPLVVERTFGRGRVIVQAVGLDIRWSNLPVCQSFVVLVNEWLWYLVEPGHTIWNLAVGEPIRVELPRGDGYSVSVRKPDGVSIDLIADSRDDLEVYSFDGTLCPGRYSLSISQDGKEARTLPFHVQRDTDESDLTPLVRSELQELTEAANVTFCTDVLSNVGIGRQESALEPIWAWLLVGLAVLLITELLLAGRLSRRRLAPAQSVVMSSEQP
jgi:hypothetical protein